MSNIFDQIMLKLITGLHLLFILFMVITPFTNSVYLLFMHFIISPVVVCHWLLNNNVCALTMMELTLREKLYGSSNKSDCITCKLIDPVYDFKNNYDSFSTLIYIITGSLWLISTYKICKKIQSGEIKSIYDITI